jgi:diguanylate cyclase (GGDEF)-like protein
MLAAINRFLASQSTFRHQLILIVLLVITALIDQVTGYELSFSIFYLFPVGFTAWYMQGRLVFFVCVLCAAIWGLIDYTSGHVFDNIAIPFWNAGVRGGFFFAVAILLRRIRSMLETQESLAQLDGLTGILNTRAFRQRCALLCDLSFRHHRPLALGYIDLDDFKKVNDSLGHSVGDQVLKATAEALSKRLRASDICARLGGDEFAVLLPDTDINGATRFFTELHEKLVGFAAQNQWPIGFSVGVAVFRLRTSDPNEAIRLADDLMYKVKKSGKNSIKFEEFGELVPNPA